MLSELSTIMRFAAAVRSMISMKSAAADIAAAAAAAGGGGGTMRTLPVLMAARPRAELPFPAGNPMTFALTRTGAADALSSASFVGEST